MIFAFFVNLPIDNGEDVHEKMMIFEEFLEPKCIL
jgi:hypothetical protein